MRKKMTHLLRRLLALALMAAMLAGCGAPQPQETDATVEEYYAIALDENGMAHWDAVEGAVEYEYSFVDSMYINSGYHRTTELSVQVPQGYFVDVTPIFANGEKGDYMSSPFFGDPVSSLGYEVEEGENPADPLVFVDTGFDTKWEDLTAWSLLPSIRWNTLQTLSDGSISFKADTPTGNTIRFLGTGVTVTESSITFAPGSYLTSLDAIGRICAISHTVQELGDPGNWIRYRDGYTFTDETHVDSPEELYFQWGNGASVAGNGREEPQSTSRMQAQGNFLHMGGDEANPTVFTLSDLTIHYDETTFNTPIQMGVLDYTLYGTYLVGERYDASKERYDMDKLIYDFALMFVPEVANERIPISEDIEILDAGGRSVQSIPTTGYTIGNLKDANGNVLDKATATLEVGATVEVTLENYTLDVALPVLERYEGAQNLHQLIPYDNATAVGSVTALVVPIYWQDQPETATDETMANIYASLGRVTDGQDNVVDYSGNLTNRFSLSGYYDIASYGQHSITSFVTDWYAAPYNYVGDKEFQPVLEDVDFREELYHWVKMTYPDMDWSRFDADGDGFLDAVILLNTGTSGDELNMSGYSYGLYVSPGYTGEGAGTFDDPAMKNFISINTNLLEESSVLIHEYAHGFGLVDYYDVTYSGANAVGGYDMQSANVGDWNAFSKYATGWLQPQVITGLAPGETVEVTLGALSDSGDALVIPAAGSDFDGPFGEYILIDLLTDGGVNCYDAGPYGLAGKAGVRISHVNANMEKRVLTGEDGVEYPIGTIHVDNTYNAQGKYLLEVIQAGKVNTFTDLGQLRTDLGPEDLFYAGDVFRVEDYSQFFQNGRMDDGSEFGYTVTVVRVSGDSATLRITRQ